MLCSCRRLGRLTGLGADTLLPVASNLACVDLGESNIKKQINGVPQVNEVPTRVVVVVFLWKSSSSRIGRHVLKRGNVSIS